MPDWRYKIDALLAKALADGTTPEERDSLQNKAMFLMTKYSIDEATLRKKDGSFEKPIMVQMSIGNPFAMRKAELLGTIAHFLGGSKAVGSGSPTTLIVTLLGFKEDIERVKVLYSSLLMQMQTELYALKTPKTENTKAYRNAFLAAFHLTILERLAKIYGEINAIPGTDIVLHDRESKIQEMVDSIFPELKEPGAITLSSQAGWNAGVSAGQRADLGQRQVT